MTLNTQKKNCVMTFPSHEINDALKELSEAATNLQLVTRCGICCSSLSKPRRIDKCNHIFCYNCIEQYKRHFKGKKLPSCPICRKEFSMRSSSLVKLDDYTCLNVAFEAIGLFNGVVKTSCSDAKERKDLLVLGSQIPVPATQYPVCSETPPRKSINLADHELSDDGESLFDSDYSLEISYNGDKKESGLYRRLSTNRKMRIINEDDVSGTKTDQLQRLTKLLDQFLDSSHDYQSLLAASTKLKSFQRNNNPKESKNASSSILSTSKIDIFDKPGTILVSQSIGSSVRLRDDCGTIRVKLTKVILEPIQIIDSADAYSKKDDEAKQTIVQDETDYVQKSSSFLSTSKIIIFDKPATILANKGVGSPVKSCDCWTTTGFNITKSSVETLEIIDVVGAYSKKDRVEQSSVQDETGNILESELLNESDDLVLNGIEADVTTEYIAGKPISNYSEKAEETEFEEKEKKLEARGLPKLIPMHSTQSHNVTPPQLMHDESPIKVPADVVSMVSRLPQNSPDILMSDSSLPSPAREVGENACEEEEVSETTLLKEEEAAREMAAVIRIADEMKQRKNRMRKLLSNERAVLKQTQTTNTMSTPPRINKRPLIVEQTPDDECPSQNTKRYKSDTTFEADTSRLSFDKSSSYIVLLVGARKPNIATTLTEAWLKLVDVFIQQNITCYEMVETRRSDYTHLLSVDVSNGSRHLDITNADLLHGIVDGKWILSYQWLLDSSIDGKLKPESRYEIETNDLSRSVLTLYSDRQGLSPDICHSMFNDAARKARLAKRMKKQLLVGYRLLLTHYLHGANKTKPTCTFDDLRSYCEKLGAQVFNETQKVEYRKRDNPDVMKDLVLFPNEMGAVHVCEKAARDAFNIYRAEVVKVQWLLDTVATYNADLLQLLPERYRFQSNRSADRTIIDDLMIVKRPAQVLSVE